MRLLGRILQAARKEDALLLYSTASPWYPDMLAAAIVGLWPKRHRSVRPVRYREFMALMRSATVVVSPVRLGMRRTAGLLTFLNAMWLKKPTIATNALGVKDYIQDGETGLIVDGTPGSYVKALRWVLDPANRDQVTCLCAKAHQVVSEQFTFENHVFSLLTVLDEAMSETTCARVSPHIKVKSA